MGSRSGLSWARSWITDSDTNLRNGSGGAGEPGSLITARGVYRYSPRTDDRTKPAGARTTFKFDITDLDTVTDPTERARMSAWWWSASAVTRDGWLTGARGRSVWDGGGARRGVNP